MASREFSATKQRLAATVTNGSGTSRLDAITAKTIIAEAEATLKRALLAAEELGVTIELIQNLKKEIPNLAGVFNTVSDLTLYTNKVGDKESLKNNWAVVVNNGSQQTSLYQYINVNKVTPRYEWRELGILSDKIEIVPAKNELVESEKDLLFTLNIADKQFPVYSTISRNQFLTAVSELNKALGIETERAVKVEKRLTTALNKETKRAKKAEKELEEKTVPRRLDPFEIGTVAKAKREKSFVYVDQEGTDKKVSLADIRAMTTKIILKKDNENLEPEQTMPGDCVVDLI